MAARPRQKLPNHIAVRTRQSHKPTNPQTHKPTNPQLQEIRVRSSMWVCGFLLNDVGFCVYQFLNPHRNSQTHVINPQTHRTHATHATHKPTRFSDTPVETDVRCSVSMRIHVVLGCRIPLLWISSKRSSENLGLVFKSVIKTIKV